ncbi:peptidase domain-containing ABC transporter [Longitalea luteola]|uniref:peptidase domain-containing ABC transporter n=1 Tax=Longitalea luteola TaxID=2812563 RepID=UPI001A96608B|nr:peptidase domain-containing ABC transporter [Longitalea luteola]
MAFPFFKQYDSMDCGPTCVRMIAQYYGKDYSLQFLREKCSIGRLGVSMLGISKAAETIGFKTLGAKITIDQLQDEMPLPCIVHWDQNHFVVVYKAGKDKIHVANPDTGLLTYKKEEFLKHWAVKGKDKDADPEGVALLLEPMEKFYEIESVRASKNGLIELLKYFRNYKQTIFQLLIALIISSLLQLMFPFLTQSIVDVGVNNKDIHFISVVLIAQVILFAGQFLSNFFRNWLLLYMSTKINVSILSDFVVKLMRVPVSFFDVKLAGDIIQRMNDHRRIESFLTGSTLNTIFSFFSLLVFGIAIFIYNKLIFLIYIFFSVLYVLYIVFFLGRRKSIEGKSMEVASAIQGNTLQMIYGIQDIRLNSAEMLKRWEWEELQANLFKINIQKLRVEQIQEIGAFFLNQCKNVLITFYTAYLVITNQLTLGEMLACQFIIGQLNGPLEQLIHFMLVAQDARLALGRIKEINEIEDEEPMGKYSADHSGSSLDNSIAIKDMSFRYPGIYKPVLHNINLEIPAGKITAIVGASGSGKTTLMKLLLKIYNPTDGKISIGDIDFSDISPSLWREKIGTVMQDGFIFSDSIEKNIALGDNKNQIDREKLTKAIKIANLTELIESLPNGLETKVGTEGLGLSQGQKQRILIARAVYKNPEIIMLDEATNALDANNEREIVNSFNDFFQGKTVIIIAHRLSTVKNADQIVVLDKGGIAEVGRHAELIKMKGFYYTLVKNQLELDA